jgi:hypothetical protein
MITTAFVEHLKHMAADGGNDAPSPVTSMVSAWESFSDSIGLPMLTRKSGFFF